VKRRLAAIFAADVEGYSRLMGADEVATLDALTARREILDGLIATHGGRIANTAGDSVWRNLAVLWMPSAAPWRLRMPWPKPTQRFLRPVTSISA
jgi:class 3 adenylate cyclase